MTEQDDLKPIQVDAPSTDEDVAELEADIEQALRKAEQASSEEQQPTPQTVIDIDADPQNANWLRSLEQQHSKETNNIGQ